MSTPRPVVYVSDGTGITAETIGHSLLTQFRDTAFAPERIPFVDSIERAGEPAWRIRGAGEACGLRPIAVSSCVSVDFTAAIAASGAMLLDVFEPFMSLLEAEL